MPVRSGRMTPKERRFVQAMARTNDPQYAATVAGYKQPEIAGYGVAARPAIREATFAAVQKFLKDEGAAIGVYTLAELAVDEAIPAGVRRAAAADLAKLSGVGVSESDAGKEPHEMTPAELDRYQAKLARQLEALQRVQSDAAKPIVEHEAIEPDPGPDPGPFG